MGQAISNRFVNAPRVSLEGCLLVAAPNWQDEVCSKAVCLIVHHGPEGAVGVFLNRGLEADAPGLWKHLAGPNKKYNKGIVHCGGPQSGPVVALHTCPDYAEHTSADGVYFAAQVQSLQALLQSEARDRNVKIIVGQADWEAGVLDQEFSEGKWLPLPVSSKLVFADNHQMWTHAMREIGNQFVVAITGGEGPTDVLAN